MAEQTGREQHDLQLPQGVNATIRHTNLVNDQRDAAGMLHLLISMVFTIN